MIELIINIIWAVITVFGIVAVCDIVHLGNDIMELRNYTSIHAPHEPLRGLPVPFFPAVYLLDSATSSRVQSRLSALAPQ
jgi:hypothetical protein